MNAYTIGEGLLIEQNNNHLLFFRKNNQSIYFENIETAEIISLSEADFFANLQHNDIKILSSNYNRKEIEFVASEQLNNIPPDLDSLTEKENFNVQWRTSFVKEAIALGLTKGDRNGIEYAIDELTKSVKSKFPRSLIESKKAPGASTICKWMKKSNDSDENYYSLISKKATQPGNKNLDKEDVDSLINDAIDNIYLTLRREGSSSTYTRYLELTQIENRERSSRKLKLLPTVSQRTLERRISDIPYQVRVTARYGVHESRKRTRMIRGHMPADYPLDYVEIDSTPINLMVIDDEAFLPLGRPTLTLLKDRYSRACIGLYVSFAGEGLDSVFGAIKHSIYPSNRINERYPDLKNEWLGGGVARRYVVDNGSAYQSPQFRRAITELGSTWEYCQTRSGWEKPFVERFFLSYESLLETLPGRTFANINKRYGYDPEKQAVIRFSSFIYLLHKWVVDVHNVKPIRHLDSTPIDLWKEGIKSYPPMFPSSTKSLDLIFGIQDEAIVGHEGITRNNLHYTSEELHSLRREFGSKLKLKIRKINSNLGSIFVLNPNTKQYFKAACTRLAYAEGLTLLQHQHIRNIRKQKFKNCREHSIENLLATKIEINETIKYEIELKNSTEKRKLARLAGISSDATLQNKNSSIITPPFSTSESETEAFSQNWDSIPSFPSFIEK